LFFIKIQKNREVMEKETMKNVPDVLISQERKVRKPTKMIIFFEKMNNDDKQCLF